MLRSRKYSHCPPRIFNRPIKDAVEHEPVYRKTSPLKDFILFYAVTKCNLCFVRVVIFAPPHEVGTATSKLAAFGVW